jgi:hypothetical protein
MFNTKKVATLSTQENLFEIARKIDRIVFDDILELNEEDKMLIIEHLEIMTRFAKTQTKD